MSTKQGPLHVGDRFLKYTIRALLGTGGHAWVYHGHDEFLDVEVAIKILHRPGGVTADMLRRGQAEAKLLYRLKHHNIVNVLDAGITSEGLLYIVMELLEGETLRRVFLKKGRLPMDEALALFGEIAEGVEAAHAFGAIHRDLKPENIFVLTELHPKVLDFGIAKVVDAAGWTTEKDVINGTVLYMAPEQLRGEKATAASDVYALGLMLFESLHGRHPLLLKNRSPTIKELTWMQLTMKPPSLDELDGAIPRHVARLVERMVLKVAAHRPASMRECAEAIRACQIRFTSSSPTPTDDTGAVALPNVTDRINDTERTEGTPFDASITLPRVPVAKSIASVPERFEPPRQAPRRSSMEPGTVRPVMAAVTRPPSRNPARGFNDDERRLMRQVLAASCVVGAALGGVYVVVTNRPSALHSAATPAEVWAPAPVTPVDAPPVLQEPPPAATPSMSTDTPPRVAPPPVDAPAPLVTPVRRRPKRHDPPRTASESPLPKDSAVSTTGPKPAELRRITGDNFPILE